MRDRARGGRCVAGLEPLGPRCLCLRSSVHPGRQRQPPKAVIEDVCPEGRTGAVAMFLRAMLPGGWRADAGCLRAAHQIRGKRRPLTALRRETAGLNRCRNDVCVLTYRRRSVLGAKMQIAERKRRVMHLNTDTGHRQPAWQRREAAAMPYPIRPGTLEDIQDETAYQTYARTAFRTVCGELCNGHRTRYKNEPTPSRNRL